MAKFVIECENVSLGNDRSCIAVSSNFNSFDGPVHPFSVTGAWHSSTMAGERSVAWMMSSFMPSDTKSIVYLEITPFSQALSWMMEPREGGR